MAKVRKVKYFMANLDDKPGALLKIMQDLKTKNLGLFGLWGFGTHEGKAQLFVVAKNTDKLRDEWKDSGLLAKEGTGFLVKGLDQTGALINILEKLSSSGINIHAIDAIAVGSNFGSFFWVQESDVEKAAKVLGVN